jgi:hypothetical protein
MTRPQRDVATAPELLAAAADSTAAAIVVKTNISGLPTFRLSPGQTLIGATSEVVLHFAAGQDGVQLSSDNRIEDLVLETDPDQRALFNDTHVEHLGRLALTNLRTVGTIRLLAKDAVLGGHIEAENIDIASADARGFQKRPQGYGVEVIPGAFVLWNQQPDRSVTITAKLTGLAAGRAGAPVRGSGIFVSGAGDAGGRLVVNHGPVMTYGANDMVLDNWGTVGSWTNAGKVTSLGASGIGFVNFGTVDVLQVQAAIETFGQGARGFNVYSGTVHSAEFERIVTHADGAVGIQISQPVGEIVVRRGIETYGGTGDSLVKGVVVKLPVVALSIKSGGSAQRISITGGLISHGVGITPLEMHGRIDFLQIAEGLNAAGCAPRSHHS